MPAEEPRDDEIDRQVLLYTVRRGARVAVTRDDYLRDLGRNLRGISYGELRKSLHRLGERGMVTMDMIGTDEFVVKPTDAATQLLEAGAITEDAWAKASSGPLQCRKCDATIPQGARFCEMCGYKLG
jgi:hypothetical protein